LREDGDSAVVRLDDALISASERGNGNGFWWRQREVVKHTPVRRVSFLSIFIRLVTEVLSALRQGFAGLRMVIVAQREEFIAPHIAAQSKCFGPFAEPLAPNTLPFAVIVSGAKMLLKILLGVRQIVLGLGREHPPFTVADRETKVAPPVEPVGILLQIGCSNDFGDWTPYP